MVSPRNRDLLQRFARFSGIGLINTAIHVFVVIALVEAFDVHSVVSNWAGFAAANVFSYWANSRWNYRTSLSPIRYVRFLIVSVLGLVITGLMSGFASFQGWHYLVGTAMVLLSLPLLTFYIHDRWTWAGC